MWSSDLGSESFEEPLEVDLTGTGSLKSHLLEACGFLNNGLAQVGVVELGMVLANEFVFKSQCLNGVGHDFENHSTKCVVVVMMMPPSDGQFHFGVLIEVDLFEFGSPVVFSADKACFCGSKIPLHGVDWLHGWKQSPVELELDVD